MNKRHEINFKSYDRLFPNQDTLPKGGFGNLIALPLQMTARQNGNSVFVDENFEPYSNQWDFLGAINKLSEDRLKSLIKNLCHGNELGALKQDEEETEKPWESAAEFHPVQSETLFRSLSKGDFPEKVQIVRANVLYILKADFSQKALNSLTRLAAFKNPEFYRSQAMRLSTYNKPRIISCSDENAKYLYLSRGCEEDIRNLLDGLNVETNWEDRTNCGRKINVKFKGSLGDEQKPAIRKLLKYDNGVLSGHHRFWKNGCGC